MNIDEIRRQAALDSDLMASLAISAGSHCAGIGTVEIKWREGGLAMTAGSAELTPVQCRKLAGALQEILQADSRMQEAGSGFSSSIPMTRRGE